MLKICQREYVARHLLLYVRTFYTCAEASLGYLVILGFTKCGKRKLYESKRNSILQIVNLKM